jgi:hypothetical protein
MVSLGLADGVLTAKPVITYWRHVIKRYTNFALESHDLDFNQGTAQFGSNPSCNLDRIGDLVYWMYVRVLLPGIGLANPTPNTANSGAIIGSNDCTPSAEEPYWTYDVGQALIEKTNFFIGGQCIDEIMSEFLFIWEELSGAPGKRLIEMVGKYEVVQSLQLVSRQSRVLYIPLYFWFTMNSGLALPLVSLQFHSVKVSVKFRSQLELLKLTCAGQNFNNGQTPSSIQKRADYKIQNYVNYCLGFGAEGLETQPASGLSPLLASDLQAQIMVTYVYLDQNERAKFAEGAFESVIPQHQFQGASVDQQVSGVGALGNDRPISIDLSFNHTVMELFWVMRLRIHEGYSAPQQPCPDVCAQSGCPIQDNGDGGPQYNEWFNFSGPTWSVTRLSVDPCVGANLLLNNANRWDAKEGRYFRLVQPYQHHTNIPLKFIYVYSFALQPQDIQPSGTCNFSRIDSTKLELVVDGRCFYGPGATGGNNGNTSVSILVFATNWNVLRFKYGLGGLRFAN